MDKDLYDMNPTELQQELDGMKEMPSVFHRLESAQYRALLLAISENDLQKTRDVLENLATINQAFLEYEHYEYIVTMQLRRLRKEESPQGN